MPVFIEVFRALASRQRMFGEMQLAERVGFETGVRAVPIHELVRCMPVVPECLTRAQRAANDAHRVAISGVQAGAAARRCTGFSTIGKLIAADRRPSKIESHQTKS